MPEIHGNPLTPFNFEDNHFPDPHIKIFINPDTGNECFYAYVGHDFASDKFVMKDWYVLYSEDLIHWTCKKTLDRRDTYLEDDSVECWACDVVQSPWDQKYYLYYSQAGKSTGVAVSDRPDGPFRDARGFTPILTEDLTPTNPYDPDIILPDKDDPRAWIVFGSDWTDHYWAMQLNENMIEVVPGTARKVPVWPDENTHEELLGVLRSDQAEAFRWGDTWYLYWAGRYATSVNRLGPYIFRGNIGADIPHYPDGRAFIDHGSFLEWRGQTYYAVSEGKDSMFFRQSWLMYLHICDDGTLMFDETIRRCGVGRSCAQWPKIEAEWYVTLSGDLKKIELKDDNQHLGFAVRCSGEGELSFPHVYDMPDNPTMTLCLKVAKGASIEVLADGQFCAAWQAEEGIADFSEIRLPLNVNAGEHTLTFVLRGEMTLDWYSLV